MFLLYETERLSWLSRLCAAKHVSSCVVRRRRLARRCWKQRVTSNLSNVSNILYYNDICKGNEIDDREMSLWPVYRLRANDPGVLTFTNRQ